MLPLLLVEEFRIQRIHTFVDGAPLFAESLRACLMQIIRSATMRVSRVKLLSALNQRERFVGIFSVVFIVRRKHSTSPTSIRRALLSLQHAYLLTLYVF